MAHAWFDISAGVAGDMVLGALLDAGADAAAVQTAIDAVIPGSVKLDTESVTRGGQRATKVRVKVLVDNPPHRHWTSIRQSLQDADLPEQTRTWALATFERLAVVEGRAHGIDPETVHFHEVGALDSIADVVGSCEALRTLGVTSVSASPVALGAGRIRAAHGDIPVPAPAVAELAVGWQVLSSAGFGAGISDRNQEHDQVDVDEHSHEDPHDHDTIPDHDHDVIPAHDHEPVEIDDHGHIHPHTHDEPAVVTTPGEPGELATPTGLALIRALAEVCEPMPTFTVTAIGVGAGGKDFADHPNVVRVVLGEYETVSKEPEAVQLDEMRANVDDLDPRVWPSVLEACLAAGAVDAWLTPIQMKKGRPAFTVSALVPTHHRDAVAGVLLTHTTTLGVRWSPVERTWLNRSFVELDLGGLPLIVKVGHHGGLVAHAAAEYESIARIADELDRPLAQVTQEAAAAIAVAGFLPGRPVPPSFLADS